MLHIVQNTERFLFHDPSYAIKIRRILKIKKPDFYGGYKNEFTCIRILAGIDIPVSTHIGQNLYYMKSIIHRKDGLFSPIFLVVDLNQEGKIIGADVISRFHDFLIPYEISLDYDNDFLWKAKYKTLVKNNGDYLQINWPKFSSISEQKLEAQLV
ncbi:hypothetical protein [Bacillus sp. SM2101]|uniref:hypothetical protein n=1 Tax=Bacillus sp. SM2101 TaxID=2805366 RepID=UPI001BDDEBF1|nr:hypothetical protein [Bacillus sp. SM2101]